MPDSFNEFGAMLAAFLPDLLAAILVLVIGWLVAFLVSKAVEALLRRTSLDDRIAGMLQGGQPSRIPIERWIALAVFWLIMVFVIIIFLNTLDLGTVGTPINNMLSEILAFLPKLLAAAVLILLAFVIATVLRLVITRVLSASVFSRRLTDEAQMDSRNRMTIGQTIGNVVYWLVFLLFLPAILDALDLGGILAPVTGMVDSILGALPNIFGAAVIIAIGYLVARVVRQIVANLLAGMGVDRLTERAGATGALRTQRLSDVLATIVFVLILIPVIIAALNVLNIPAISEPAAEMLTTVLNAIPAIFAAFVLIAVAFFVARLLGNLVSSILAGLGFDRLFSPGGPIPVTGVASMPVEGQVGGTRTSPSQVVGWIVVIAILLFAAAEAADLLGFETLTLLIGEFIVAAWNILFGLIIFGIGLWLSNVAYNMVRNTGTTNAHILATVARVAILVFAGALALRQMGIAEDIVNLAFGLMLGAVAVAAAIAFGIGGRNVAADLLERWRGQLREEAAKPTPPPPPSTTPGIPQTGTTTGGATTFTDTDMDDMTGTTTTPRSSFTPDEPMSDFDPDNPRRDFDTDMPPRDFDPDDPRPTNF